MFKTMMIIITISSNVYGGIIEDTSTLVKEFEGFRSRPYMDNTQTSIGYGTHITYVRKMYPGVSYVTKEMANNALESFLRDGLLWLNKLEGFNTLPDSAKIALLSVWYNGPSMIGPKTRYYIRNKNLDKLSTEIAWGNNPKNKHGLVKRRIVEANLIRKSENLPMFPTPKSVEEFQRIRWNYLK